MILVQIGALYTSARIQKLPYFIIRPTSAVPLLSSCYRISGLYKRNGENIVCDQFVSSKIILLFSYSVPRTVSGLQQLVQSPEDSFSESSGFTSLKAISFIFQLTSLTLKERFMSTGRLAECTEFKTAYVGFLTKLCLT